MLNWKPALTSLTFTLELKDRLDTGRCMSAPGCPRLRAFRLRSDYIQTIFRRCTHFKTFRHVYFPIVHFK